MVTFDPVRDLQDLTGKVAIVTGATSGIGYTTAQQLLRKGATVYLAARNESKATGTIARLEAEGLEPGKGKPVFHMLSLDDPRDAKASAEAFLKRETRLDILVNNAASFFSPFKLGAMGCEETMVINHISPFVFTNTLLPLLKATALQPGADIRIVIVASDMHSMLSNAQFKTRADFKITFEDQKFPKMRRYALTKIANILWTRELARRLSQSTNDGGTNIIVVCLDPGSVRSEGSNLLPTLFPWPISWLVSALIPLFMVTPEEGAYCSSYAAGSPDVRRDPKKYHGSYIVSGCKVKEPSKLAMDDGLARDLWELTENILKEEGV